MKANKSKNILIVEDDLDMANLEEAILKKYGYNVIIAISGEESIKIVNETQNINLILMDIDLGKGIDGTKAAEIILKKHTIPLIFISSHTEPEIVEKTEGITSYGYIVKNSGETVFLASIKMAFRLFESRMKEMENEIFRKRVVENSLVPIIVMDGHTFKYIECNPAAISIYKFTSLEETLGKTPLDVSAPYQYDGTASAIKSKYYIDIAINNRQVVFEWLHQRPNKELWDAEVHLMSFYVQDQLFLQFTLKDITERKRAETQLQESQKRYKALFVGATEGILVADIMKMQFSFANPALCNMFGYTEEEITKLGIADIHPKESLPHVISEFKAQARGEKTLATNIPCLRKNGTIFYADINTSTIILDGCACNLGFFNDITERKQLIEIQQILSELVIELNSYNDLHHGVDKVLKTLIKLDCIDCGAIYIYDQILGSLDMIVHHGLSKNFVELVSHFDSDSARVSLSLTGKASYGTYTDIFSNLDQIRLKEGLRAFATIPIMAQGQLIAVLNLSSHTSETIPAQTRKALETIAFHIGGTLLRLQTNDSLKKSEKMFNSFINQSDDGIIIINNKGIILEWNKGVEKITGIPQEETLNKPIWEIQYRITPAEKRSDEYLYILKQKTLKGLKEGADLKRIIEEEIQHPDGTRHTMQSILFGIKNDRELLAGSICRDITERKLAEDENKSLLQEKTILLKEVHHRIKNNILSIESLLTLQSYSIKNPEALSLLQDVISRVTSMRILYDNLLLTENYTEISSKSYFEKLFDTIITLFPNNKKITIKKSISEFILHSKIIVPMGIIVNELITNIMKYAFIDREEGILEITISKSENKISIIISDNGVGFPVGFNKEKNKGFGYTIVDMLVKQIKASLKIENKKGTKCIIEYEINAEGIEY